jgi:DEAD/DEAH box helicase domain-containing protein
MAVGITWDSIDKKFEVFMEEDIDKLITKFKSSDLVVGFNIIRFDYGVLSAYATFDFKKLPTFDILQDVEKRLGHRLSLDSLVKNTLNKPKLADGVQSLEWWKTGEKQKVIAYCTSDVELTRDLFEFGLKEGYLIYEKRGTGAVRLSVDWNLTRIVKETKKT